MRTIPAGMPGEEVRCWVYSQVSALFGAIPPRLEPLEDHVEPQTGATEGAPGAGVTGAVLTMPGAPLRPYPRTRAAVARLIEAFARQARERIEVDQARLFVNAPDGVGAPPYASWYLDRRLMGPSCTWVAGEYRQQALEIAAHAGEPADYIGTELEYMYFLCRHAHAAHLTGDRAALDLARAAERRFFNGHLARWVPAFAERIRAAHPGEVFAGVADVLAGFCDEERERLG